MEISELNKTKQEAQDQISQAQNLSEIDSLKLKLLGKKGVINSFTQPLANLPNEQKAYFGKEINKVKDEIGQLLQQKEAELKSVQKDIRYSKLYKSLPGDEPDIGHIHIITQAIREIVEIFKPLGFSRVRYPEVEWEYFAFDALNMHKDHPARDEWETFFVNAPEDPEKGKVILTPHTSNGQIREMLKGELPIRMLNISRCGRRQIDVNHVPTFFQFEGLVVDQGINIAHLKGVLNYFAKNFYGEDREIRLRPYDFRFTEPSFEVDINCGLCHGEGCRFCKGGWVELGGAGMVHPKVLEHGHVDPYKYTGFAFGWGVERTYMMKSGTKIDDIRHLFNNDLRFLEQF